MLKSLITISRDGKDSPNNSKDLALPRRRLTSRKLTETPPHKQAAARGRALHRRKTSEIHEETESRMTRPRVPTSFSVDDGPPPNLSLNLSGVPGSESEVDSSPAKKDGNRLTTSRLRNLTVGGSLLELTSAAKSLRPFQRSSGPRDNPAAAVSEDESATAALVDAEIAAKEEELRMLRVRHEKAEAAVSLLERRLKAKADASASLLKEAKAAKEALAAQLVSKEEELGALVQTGTQGSSLRRRRSNSFKSKRAALLRALTRRTTLKAEHFVEEEDDVMLRVHNAFDWEVAKTHTDDGGSPGKPATNPDTADRSVYEVSILKEQLAGYMSENVVLKEELQELQKTAQTDAASTIKPNEEVAAEKAELLLQSQRQLELLQKQLCDLRGEHRETMERLKSEDCDEATQHRINCLQVENEALKKHLCALMERHGEAMGAKDNGEAAVVQGEMSKTCPPADSAASHGSGAEQGGDKSSSEMAEGTQHRSAEADEEPEKEHLSQGVGGLSLASQTAFSADELRRGGDESEGCTGGMFEGEKLELVRLQGTVAVLRSENQALRDEFQDSREHFQRELENAAMESEALREQMQKDAAAAAVEIDRLKEENAALEEHMRQESRTFGFRIDSLHEQRFEVEEEMRQEIVNLTFQLDNMEEESAARMEQLRNEAATAALQAAALSEANAALEDRLEREGTAAAHQILKLKTEKTALEIQVEDLSREVESLSEELHRSQASAQECLSDDTASLRVQLRVLQAEKSALEKQLQDTSEETKSRDDGELRRDLAEAGLELVNLKEYTRGLEHQFRGLMLENEELRREVDQESPRDVLCDSSTEVVELLNQKLQQLLTEKADLQKLMRKEAAAAAVQVNYLIAERVALEEKLMSIHPGEGEKQISRPS